MYSWRNFVDKLRRYSRLETFEKRGLAITILAIGFMFFFFLSYGPRSPDWAAANVEVGAGVVNLLLTILLVALVFLVHEVTHRIIALWMGYRSQFKAWIIGLVIGLIVAFVSSGALIFIAPGSLIITTLEIHRLGKGWTEINMKHLGWIAMSGPIAVMFLAVIMKSLFELTGVPIFHKAMLISIWVSIFDMLPIPPFNGSRTFFGSRYVYVFVLGSLVGCAALLSYFSGIVPIIGSIVLGALVLLVFFAFIDKKW